PPSTNLRFSIIDPPLTEDGSAKVTNEKTAKVNPLSFWIYIHYTSPQKADGAQLGPRAHT
ncbi:MAG TPA: hypothetical protein PKY84_07180, partial [Thermosynergistes sp.]|nr:hypothetical protein [Thermosynergistes sp.]